MQCDYGSYTSMMTILNKERHILTGCHLCRRAQIVVCSIILVGVSAEGPHLDLPPREPYCTVSWQRRGEQRSSDNNAMLDYAEAVGWRGGVAAVGETALEWLPKPDSLGNTAHPIGGIVWDKSGLRTLLPPIALRVLMYPRVAATDDGLLQVIYGTRTDLSNRTVSTTPDTLWHTTFNGRVWTTPRPLPQSPSGPVWFENLASSSLVAYKKRLDFVGAVKSRDSTTLLHLHRDEAGVWTGRSLVTGGGIVGYARLERVGSVLLVIYAGPDPASNVDRASVFAMRSVDDGRTWSKPTRLFSAGVRTSYDHSIVVDSSGRAFLFWQQHSGQRGRPSDTVAVRITSDSGRTWAEGPALSIPNGLGQLRATLSSAGPLVLFDDFSTGRTVMLFRDMRWIRPNVLPGKLRTNNEAMVGSSLNPTILIGSEMKEVSQTSLGMPLRPSTGFYEVAVHCRK